MHGWEDVTFTDFLYWLMNQMVEVSQLGGASSAFIIEVASTIEGLVDQQILPVDEVVIPANFLPSHTQPTDLPFSIAVSV